MTWLDPDTAQVLGSNLALLICFRAFPIVPVLLFGARTSAALRLAAALAIAALILCLMSSDALPLGWLLLGYAYFAAAGALAIPAVRLLRAGRLEKPLLFALCAAAFLLCPALIMPPVARGALLLIGWDMVLSAYSYVVDVATSDEPPRLSSCWFFLLVNPVLVYAQRGERFADPAFDARGVQRAALGLLTLAVAMWASLSVGRAGAVVSPLYAYALPALLFVIAYLQHSGLASFQIGMLRQLGLAIPERYQRPLLSRGPLEFWPRWNTYVATWAQRYVLWPTALTLGRGRGRKMRRWAQVAGVIATFAAVGLLHDAFRFASGSAATLRGLCAFSASALLVLVWAGARELHVPNGVARAVAEVGRVSFWIATIALFAWYGQ